MTFDSEEPRVTHASWAMAESGMSTWWPSAWLTSDGDVLHERAAGGDIEHLQAPAHGEHRRVLCECQPCELQLECIACGIG